MYSNRHRHRHRLYWKRLHCPMWSLQCQCLFHQSQRFLATH
jgi:hypothetical protein